MTTTHENKVGYKKTKLGWIPEDWKILNVSEVFDFLSTNSFSRNQMNYSESDGCLYNIHYGDIHATYYEPILDLDKCKQVPVIDDDVSISSSISYLKEGDIVMADASEDYAGVGATIELLNVNDKKIVAGLHTLALRDNLGVTCQGYRAHLFKHPKVSVSLKVIATGSKVYGISKSNLLKISLVLPPLPEQQKIASILITWDKAIEKLTQLVATKEQLKKGLMQLLLTGKKRFAGFSEEWEEVKLERICQEKGIVRGPFGGALKKEIFIESGYKVYEQQNAIYKSTDLGKYFIDEQKYNEMIRFSVKPNDLILSCSGTIGRVFRIPTNAPKGIINQALLKLSIDSIKVDIYFFEHLLNSDRIQNSIVESTQGGAMKNLIGMSEFRNLKFSIPSLQEQQKIASTLSVADKEIELLKQELNNVQQQKTGLMQKLLTGEVRVKI